MIYQNYFKDDMDYQKRLETLSKQLDSIPCDALLIEHPMNIFYLTGLELSTGKLIVTSKQGSHLIVDGRYFESCKKNCPCQIYELDKMPLKKWLSSHVINRFAFESDNTTYQSFENLQKVVGELDQQSDNLTLVPVPSPVMELRMIKDADEIELIIEASRLGYEGYKLVVSSLREGISEKELAFELEFFWKKRGAKKYAFDPIIAFGANSSMPHYRAGATKLEKGMVVLIDIGVTLNHYNSDMTRVVFFGEPNPKIQEIFSIVSEAKNKALSLCRPGTLIGELDRAARDLISAKGYGEHFMHGLGHGLGLDVHEPPNIRSNNVFSDKPLKPGMVITIEPGIYLPEIGGVRLEDTILITDDGYKNLTQLN